MPDKDLMLVSCHDKEEMSQCSANIPWMSREKAISCILSAHRSFLCLQGSYWAIDTNPKEDALPTRPKKRPRSGERVSLMRETLHILFFCKSLCLCLLLVQYFSVPLTLYSFLFLLPSFLSHFLPLFLYHMQSHTCKHTQTQ